MSDEELNQAALTPDENSEASEEAEQLEESQSGEDLEDGQKPEDGEQEQEEDDVELLSFDDLKQQLVDEGLGNQPFVQNAKTASDLVKGYADWGKGLRAWASQQSQRQAPARSQPKPQSDDEAPDPNDVFWDNPVQATRNAIREELMAMQQQQNQAAVRQYVNNDPRVMAYAPHIDQMLAQNNLALTPQTLDWAWQQIQQQAKAHGQEVLDNARQEGEKQGRSKTRAFAEGAGVKQAPGTSIVNDDMTLQEMEKAIDRVAGPPRKRGE